MSYKNENDKNGNQKHKKQDKSSKAEIVNYQNNKPDKMKRIHKLSPFTGLTPVEEKKLTRRLTGILVTLTIGILITLYIISPLSKLQGVIVDGVSKANEQSIVTASQLKVGDNIWLQYFDKTKDMQQVVKKNPRVKTAKLSITKLNHFRINITEYDVLAVLSKNNKLYPVLSNGKILTETATDSEKSLPKLVGFKEGEGLDSLLASYDHFSPKIKSEITSIESQSTKTNPFRIKLQMKDGNEVIGLSTTIADKLVFYDKIVAELKNKSVIDMEAGKTGVYSYPIETQESSASDGLSNENSSESINNGF